MSWLLGFICLLLACSLINADDYLFRNKKHDPYLLKRGHKLEEDEE